MAILNLATISSDVKTAQIETSTWKARKAIAYYAGEHLSGKEKARLLEDMIEYIVENEPQNCPVHIINTAMLEKGHQCSEYVIQKMLAEYIEKAIEYNAARKVEGGV